MSQYPPEKYERYGWNVKVELDLSNYATKADLEAAGIDTSTLASKADLTSFEIIVDNLDVNKPKTVPADLSKLSDVVDNVVVKNLFDKLVSRVNAIDTKASSTSASGLVTKTLFDLNMPGLQKKKKKKKKKKMKMKRLTKRYSTILGW